MKKTYETPRAIQIDFSTQDVLAGSTPTVIIPSGNKGGGQTEIGKVTIF